jgi:hypothetical protein
MTGTDANDDDPQSAPRMSEWMKVMLEEMDRKRAEHEEAKEELERRGEKGEHGDDARRPGEPKDPSSTS